MVEQEKDTNEVSHSRMWEEEYSRNFQAKVDPCDTDETHKDEKKKIYALTSGYYLLFW